jgi:hypothetical protein
MYWPLANSFESKFSGWYAADAAEKVSAVVTSATDTENPAKLTNARDLMMCPTPRRKLGDT